MANAKHISRRRVEAITPAQYRVFQDAYDFFNRELFSSSLPHVLVTLQRKARAKGYFSPRRFQGRVEDTTTHELAMNPDIFINRSDEEILSTLVHEMAHVWQQVHGKPSRTAYHNRQWAAKMKEIGLQPTNTGEAGGKETGQRMTHYILRDGPYAKAYAKLKAKGLVLHWQSAPATKQSWAKIASKTRFTCSTCAQNAWAKPDAKLGCYACFLETGTLVLMCPPSTEDVVLLAGALPPK